jgi:NADH dehydrogenase FAD-containing subunit
MSKTALDILAEKLVGGATPQAARRAAILQTSAEIGKQLASRALEEALTSVGLHRTLAPMILGLVKRDTETHMTRAIQVVIGGGGAAGIPTAKCLKTHLPPDRDPTREEVQAAIEACRKETRQKGKTK